MTWPASVRSLDGEGADRAICLLLLVLWFAVTLAGHWQSPSSDLAPLYMAGWFLAEGRPDLVYAAPPLFFGGTPPAWKETLDALGNPWPHAFPYIYPPLWAKLLSYLTPLVGPVAFTKAVMVLHVAMLTAAVAIAARLARPSGMRPLIWVVISLALLQTSVFSETALHFNQPQITVMFLTLLAFERLQAGSDRTAGVLLGVAAAIKILPGVFVLLFLFERRWRAAAIFAATVAGLVVLSFLVAGAGLHGDFLTAVDRIENTLPVVPSNASAQVSFLLAADALGLLSVPTTPAGAFLTTGEVPFLPVVAMAARVLLVALLAAFAFRLAPRDPFVRRARSLLALSVLIALFSPVGWLHYYVISLLLLPQLAAVMPPRLALPAFVVFGAMTSSTLYIQSVLAFGWDWTIINIAVSALWFGVLFVIWRSAGRPAAVPAR
ncbi:MAG TPA: glycosyltransferase family 87 protein [Albidovulum sp.]|mgnify:CR=1 FL=1|uniref:glycosyltransferase family 87 protein n=1 Tax=Albidovulum sp. TaxID=1872424 RepID=UPI002BCA4B54|nr:glycosyltransferase family 87 protein [Albidovulum sp.]HRV64117.1 glycosyltransferase family 87 protein [Albidovulum sp.]